MGQIIILNPGSESDHKLTHALNYLMNKALGAEMFWHMYTDPRPVHILFIKEGTMGQSTSYTPWDAGLGVANVIRWDPEAGLKVNQANGVVGTQSPALGLAHEFKHFLNGLSTNYAEYVTTQWESDLAQSLGEPVRPTYDSTPRTGAIQFVTNTTASSTGQYWKATDAAGHIIFGPAYNASAPTVTVSNTSEAGAGGSFENMWWEPIYATGAEIWPTPKTPGGYWNPYIYPQITTPPTEPEQFSIEVAGNELYASPTWDGSMDIKEPVELIGNPPDYF